MEEILKGLGYRADRRASGGGGKLSWQVRMGTRRLPKRPVRA